MRRLPALLSVLLALLGCLPALARTAPETAAEAYAAICEQAALQAAAESGVPPDILTALTLTETGRRLGGRIRPWAWSINAEGAGTWHDDPQSALDFAEQRLRQGRRNMDLGCFQINYRWHGHHFGSVAEMLDPLANARYAARFVRELHAETGDWRAAAGAFHSRTPQHASKYLARFDQLRATVRQQGFTPPQPEQRLARLAPVAAVEPPRPRRIWDMPRGIAQRAGPQTAAEARGGMVGDDPALAALDRFVAEANGVPLDGLAAWTQAADEPPQVWSGRTPGASADDPFAGDALDPPPSDEGREHPAPALFGAARALLTQAVRPSAEAGGGSLAANWGSVGPLLGPAAQPISVAAAQPLPGLPEARTGPPASNSSLWQMAALE